MELIFSLKIFLILTEFGNSATSSSRIKGLKRKIVSRKLASFYSFPVFIPQIEAEK